MHLPLAHEIPGGLLKKSLFLVFTLLLFAVSLHAQTTISLSPANPTPGQTVTATIQSKWSDSCVPTSAAVAIFGDTIFIEAQRPNCATCLAVITDYTLTVTFAAPATVGAYDVEYTTVDCLNRRALQGTTELQVSTGGCDFGHSLTVEPPSIRVGQTITLRWCSPATQTPDNAFTVNSYVVFYSRSPNGPFAQLMLIQGAATLPTSTQFVSGSTDIGTSYFYVEARGCTSTITGECVSTTRVTNIESVTVSSATGCAPNATTLCLGDGRFQVRARWHAPNGVNGDGRPVQLTGDSGYFWFFGEGNVELTVKVLNACSIQPPAYWVFAAGMTNVEVELTVTDTKNNVTKTYTNPQGTTFVTKTDTNAFACP
jgi:hypothetical protein